MKILLLNNLYPPTVVGGAERSVEILARGLAERGTDVTVVCLTDGEEDSEDLQDGVRVHRLAHGNVYWPFNEERQSSLKRLQWHLRDAGDFSRLARLEAITRDLAPDAVHTNNLVGFGSGVIPLLKRLRLPVIHTLRDFGLICSRSSIFKNLNDCENRCASCKLLTSRKAKAADKADLVVGNSSFMVDRHRHFGVFRETPSRTIYNAVPGILDERAKSHREEGTELLHLGFAGAIKPEKGIEVLLEALTRIDPGGWRLSIAGTGDKSYVSSLMNTYRELPVDWVGFVPIQPFLEKIDLLIIPSIWPEPMPRTLIEAMAHRLPVFVSDAGGSPEVAAMYEGAQLYPHKDAAALARLLEVAVTNHPKPTQPSEEVLQTFSVDRLVDNYLDAYKEAIAINSSKADG